MYILSLEVGIALQAGGERSEHLLAPGNGDALFADRSLCFAAKFFQQLLGKNVVNRYKWHGAASILALKVPIQLGRHAMGADCMQQRRNGDKKSLVRHHHHEFVSFSTCAIFASWSEFQLDAASWEYCEHPG